MKECMGVLSSLQATASQLCSSSQLGCVFHQHMPSRTAHKLHNAYVTPLVWISTVFRHPPAIVLVIMLLLVNTVVLQLRVQPYSLG